MYRNRQGRTTYLPLQPNELDLLIEYTANMATRESTEHWSRFLVDLILFELKNLTEAKYMAIHRDYHDEFGKVFNVELGGGYKRLYLPKEGYGGGVTWNPAHGDVTQKFINAFKMKDINLWEFMGRTSEEGFRNTQQTRMNEKMARKNTNATSKDEDPAITGSLVRLVQQLQDKIELQNQMIIEIHQEVMSNKKTPDNVRRLIRKNLS